MNAGADARAEGPPFTPSLLPAARLGRELAEQHCLHAIGGDCRWYHSAWVYLRALGVVKSAGGHGEFLRERLAWIARERGARRVLISGAADHATALVAIEAFRDAPTPLELTLVDRCETPLALSRWCASREQATLNTQQADILSFDTSLVDVVIANSFLSFVHETLRPRLFERWSASLQPGGMLLLTNRLRPGASPDGIAFTPAQAQRFCAQVAAQAQKHRTEIGLDPAALEQWARDYTARLKGFPLGSVEQLERLLQHAGFAIETMDVAVAGASTPRVAGPASAESGRYVRVLARRN